MMPLISVISPCLNAAGYLEKAISSVQAQSFSSWELLVVDDGSTDGSDVIATEMAAHDARIVPIRTSGRIGASRARNLGLSAARGRYVAFLDCDDWWDPSKLSTQLAAMDAADAAFCCSPYAVCGEDGHLIRIQRVGPPVTSRRYLRKHCVIGCLTVLVDTGKLGQFRFRDHLRKAEDFVLWFELLKRCEQLGLTAVSTDAPLAYYRVHAAGQSRGKLQHARAHWRIYSEELGLSLPQALACFVSYVANGVLDRIRAADR